MATYLYILFLSVVASALEIQRIPITSSPPSIRHQFTTAYDYKSEVILLYGGFGRDAEIYSDFWIFDIKTSLWNILNPDSSILPGN